MAELIFKPIFNQNQLNKMLAKFKDRVIEKIIILLTRAGDYFVSHARQNHTYENRTGNLTSSIGYIVVQDGTPIKISDFEQVAVAPHVITVNFTVKGGKYAGKKVEYQTTHKGGDGSEGKTAGENLAFQLASRFTTGIVLICVAGMEYGKYVEAMGYDVITGASIATEAFIKRDIIAIMNKL